MKKMIFSIAVVAIFAACSSKSNEADLATSLQAQTASADTAGLAEYQSWKQQKERLQPINMNGVGSTDNGIQSTAPAAVIETPKTITKVIYRDRVAKAPKEIKYQQPQEAIAEPTYTTPRPTGPTREAVSRNDAGVGANGAGSGVDTAGAGSTNGSVVINKPAEAPAKQGGWSKAAKGTAIGAASGAVLGAIVSKNKGLGAVIGGVAGGLGGYAIGRSKDKKDGRYLVVNN